MNKVPQLYDHKSCHQCFMFLTFSLSASIYRSNLQKKNGLFAINVTEGGMMKGDLEQQMS